jgi:ABC-type sugar transport system ATPase subunit
MVIGPGLVVRGISKSYGATKALSDVSVAIEPGQVVALIGHNGAGKSTLLRILSGAEVPDEGTINIDGIATHFESPSDASAAGIACVYQELSLVNELTVAENLFLGNERLAGPFLDRRTMNRLADELCAAYRIPAAATDSVGQLSVAQRQLLEVARAINRDAKYLLLDEPTTALERQQVDELLDMITRLAAKRGIGVLFIDHKLEEVFAVADHIVGLSNGQVVLDGDAHSVAHEDVIEAIVGAGSGERQSRASAGRPMRADDDGRFGEVVLDVRGLRGNGLGGVDLQVHAGEILGIYGLVGSGRSRFLRTLYGVEPVGEGTILLRGKRFIPKTPSHAIAEGIAFLSEERKFDGLVQQMTPVENVILPVLDRYMSVGLLSWHALKQAADHVFSSIAIRGDLNEPVSSLSGGNQQKTLFARALLQSPSVLLLDEPTKGVDVGAKAEIHGIIRELAGHGRCVVVVSSEEEELLAIADRVVVFRNGFCDGRAMPVAELTVSDLRRYAWTSAS